MKSQVLKLKSKVVLMTILLIINFQSTALFASGPGDDCEAVNCEAGFYQTIDNDGKLVRYEYDGFSLGFTLISTFGFTVNATAFNIQDNYLYTISRDSRSLIQFSSDGSWTNLGVLSLPENVVVGSFDNDGFYYVCGINRPNIYKIDLATQTFETLTVQGPRFGGADWVYISCENKFYGVGNDNLLYAFDPTTSVMTTSILSGDLGQGHYGGAFTDINGALYVSNNMSGNIYAIDVTSAVSTLILSGPSSGTNDGTSCPCSVPPFPTLFPQDDEMCISDDETIEIFLNDSYSFADLDYSSFEVVEPPTNGNVFYTQQTGSVFYLSDDPSQPDSFVYKICLDIDLVFCEEATVRFIPSFSEQINASICDGEEVIIDGFSFDEEGSYDLTYTASNGCDSIITLNLEVAGASDINIIEQICEEEEFVFEGVSYTEPGTFEFNYMTSQGCDSTVVLDLTINPVYEDSIDQVICEGEEYVFDDQIYDTEGEYIVSYVSATGCDSLFTINLKVNTNQTASIEGSLCNGEAYELNGVTYTESGVFTQELNTVNGCDSTLTLSLQVAENIEACLTENICEGEELTLEDGSVFSEGGDYEIVLQAFNGCDSTLSLRVNVLPSPETQFDREICSNEVYTLPDGTAFSASGSYELMYPAANGCDSTFMLNLIVNDVFEEEIEEFICQGESFMVGGDVYTETGDYTNQFLTANNCDSIINLKLTVGEIYTINMEQEICDGETYIFGSDELTSTGIYEQNLLTTSSCDSTIVLDLRVLENKESDLTVSICEGNSFDLGQESYSEEGQYSAQFTASNGCDSLVTLNLSVAPNFTLEIEESICDGEAYVYNGVPYTESGNHEFFIEGQDGCDSMILLSVVKYNNATEQINATICEGEDFISGGQTYTSEGVFTQNYFTSNGCDSIVTIDLKVNPAFEVPQEDAICEGEQIQIGQEIFTQEGIYEVMFTTVTGCDSLITLDLTVFQNEIVNIKEELCDGEVVEIGSEVYSATGVYTNSFSTVQGCDSSVVLDLVVHPKYEVFEEGQICESESYVFAGEEFTETGIHEVRLQSSNGCDSILVLDLLVNEHEEIMFDQTICFGSTYSFGGETYDEAGEYMLNLFTTSGCDSTVTLMLNLADRFEVNLIESICEGEEVTVGNNTYKTTGVYTNSFNSVLGCDSSVVLDLMVHPNYEIFEETQICETEFYSFGGQTFTESGIHEVRLQSSKGCDSILVLDLLVNTHEETSIEETICIGSTYIFGGDTYEEAGEYSLNLFTSAGCDSTVTLMLSLADRYETNLIESICEGEEIIVGAESFSESGTYEVLMVAENGCDSLISLTLEKFFSDNVPMAVSICDGDSYTFGADGLQNGGTYAQELTNVHGCDSLVTLDLTILEVYEFEFDQEICEGESYEIGNSSYSSSGTYFYTFISANNCDSTIVTNLIVRQNTMSEEEVFTCFEDQVGQETFVFSNFYGCDSTVLITTTLLPSSECFVVVDAVGMTIPCMQSIGFLTVDILIGTPPFTINWIGPDAGTTIQAALGTFSVENLPPGSYTIEIIDANGNSTSTEASLLEFEVPDVVADIPLNSSGYNIDCFGGTNGSASVTAIGGTAPYTYVWSNGATGEEIQNLSAGIYSVTLTDVNDCIDVTVVEIIEPEPLSLDVDPIDLACDDPQSGVVTIAPAGGVPPYNYSLNGSESQTDNTFIDLAQGSYNSLVTDANGCTSEDAFSLFMPTAVDVEFGEEVISVDLGDLVQLEASLNLGTQEINTVSWSANLETDCDDCLTQTFMPSETGIYTIYVLDENGCEDTDQIMINVDTEQTIYIPNAFSPNGDGINDTFTLYSDSRFSPIISELHIYDRWGNQVFSNYNFPPNAEEFGWKGDFRGKLHNPGVFVYHATVEYIDGSTEFFKGDVTLVN